MEIAESKNLEDLREIYSKNQRWWDANQEFNNCVVFCSLLVFLVRFFFEFPWKLNLI